MNITAGDSSQWMKLVAAAMAESSFLVPDWTAQMNCST